MEFIATFFQTILIAVGIGAVSFCGILFGKRLRTRKDAKDAEE